MTYEQGRTTARGFAPPETTNRETGMDSNQASQADTEALLQHAYQSGDPGHIELARRFDAVLNHIHSALNVIDPEPAHSEHRSGK